VAQPGASDQSVAGAHANPSDEPHSTYRTHSAGFYCIPTWTSDQHLWWRAQSEACYSGPDRTVLETAQMRLKWRLKRRLSDSYQAEVHELLAGRPTLGSEAQAATQGVGLTRKDMVETCNFGADTYLIAELYSAGQLDGFLILLE
jgi:hypothetical protein